MAEPTPSSNDLQQKYRQFLDLLPLTITSRGPSRQRRPALRRRADRGPGDHIQGGVSGCAHGRKGMPGRIVRALPVKSAARMGFSGPCCLMAEENPITQSRDEHGRIGRYSSDPLDRHRFRHPTRERSTAR